MGIGFQDGSVLHVGIDEAGYGPLLGPLCIGAAAFRVARGTPWCEVDRFRVDLRRPLRGLIGPVPKGRTRGSRALPVPVDDSKRVLARFGVTGLARGVGAFASALDRPPPEDLADLLFRFSDRQAEEFASRPWFEDLYSAPVPRYPWTGPLDERFRRKGVEALDLRVLPVDAAELNEAFEVVGNKARVLGTLSATLLLSVLDRYPGEDALVVMDRQGGRKDYAGYLADIFPFARVDAVPAPKAQARYVVGLPDRKLRFVFATRGDETSLACGWASLIAKLTRELFMTRLNAWFGTRVDGLRPTAGYVQDGRRFLEDVGSVLEDEGLDLLHLVRTR